MTDGEAIRRGVVLKPDDDLPRLIYADWLDENGRPDRAMFIRAQIEAAHAEPFSPAARAATERADSIVKKYRPEWTRHLNTFVDSCEFCRGFLGRVTVNANRFREIVASLFDLEPVQSLTLVRDLRETWLPLQLDNALLNQLRRVELPGIMLLHSDFDILLRSPHLKAITDLSLRGNPLQPSMITELLRSEQFPNLVGLDLSEIPHIGPALTAALERVSHRRLLRANFNGITFRSSDLQRVLSSAFLRDVEELQLGWGGGPSHPGPITYLDLAWALPWRNLRLLNLAGQGIGPEGVRELTRQPEAANIRWLGLASNALGLEGGAILARAPHLHLYYLDVRGNGLGPADLEDLRDRYPQAVVIG